MDASQVADLLGTLATAGVVGLVILGVLSLAGRRGLRSLRLAYADLWLPFAALVALVATSGSLWFSEGAHFPPCELCWYQRIAMYPLVLLLGVAAIRRDLSVRLYGVVIAGAGLLVSAWHNLIETFPDLDTGGCDPTNPCTIRWVEGLGFWTIPRMAFVAFALVLAALVLAAPPEPEVP